MSMGIDKFLAIHRILEERDKKRNRILCKNDIEIPEISGKIDGVRAYKSLLHSSSGDAYERIQRFTCHLLLS